MKPSIRRVFASSSVLLVALACLTFLAGLFGLSASAIASAIQLTVLGVGAWLVIRGNLTAGTLFTFLALVGQIIGPVQSLSAILEVLHQASGAMDRSAAIDRYGEAFRAAMRKLLPEGEIVLPLSGGRDSRHILFEIVEAGRKPLAVTMRRWAPDIDDDLTIARTLAARFKMKHAVLGATPAKARAQCRASALTGFSSDELGWMLPMRAFLDRRKT